MVVTLSDKTREITYEVVTIKYHRSYGSREQDNQYFWRLFLSIQMDNIFKHVRIVHVLDFKQKIVFICIAICS